MAVTQIAVDVEFRYELEDAGPVLTRHKLRYDGHREVLTPPPSGQVIDIATDDEYLFALQDNGEIWRQQYHSLNWNQLTQIPLGVTSISTTQGTLQMIHGGGTAVSSLKLPGDYGLELTDTAGLTNIVQVEGDEKQRLILLGDGSLFVQRYHRGAPDPVVVPAGITQIDIGIEFTYLMNAAGEVWRIKDYAQTGPDPLAGFTGGTAIGVASNHLDTLWVATAGGTISATPETWIGAVIPPTGWVYGVGTTSGNEEWVVADWVEVA